jgi:hypothetical protein
MKNLVTALTAVTLAATGMVAGAVAAAADTTATGCYASGCYGKDPQAMGCGADAVTGASVVMPDGALVELRWSYACQAAWARITGARADEWLFANGPASQVASTFVDAPGQTSGWTPMVMDRSYVDTANACGANDIVTYCTVGY